MGGVYPSDLLSIDARATKITAIDLGPHGSMDGYVSDDGQSAFDSKMNRPDSARALSPGSSCSRQQDSRAIQEAETWGIAMCTEPGSSEPLYLLLLQRSELAVGVQYIRGRGIPMNANGSSTALTNRQCCASRIER